MRGWKDEWAGVVWVDDGFGWMEGWAGGWMNLMGGQVIVYVGRRDGGMRWTDAALVLLRFGLSMPPK